MNNDKFIKGIFIGMIAGSIIGILFAPKQGSEFRDDLKDKADYLRKKLRKKARMLEEDFDDNLEEAKEMYSKFKNSSPRKKDEVRQEFKNFIKRIEEINDEED